MGGFFKQPICHQYFWAVGGSVLCFLNDGSLTRAQIIPDETLPAPTTVTAEGNSYQIRGGTRVGDNLFHSFQAFSVPRQHEALFDNAAGIQTILSRVTGGTLSEIDGLIRANGAANLFLINPNGIVFGAEARLNIGGSFIGSTANQLTFADGSVFSATPAQSPPLLTINVPTGLQFGANPAPIVNRGELTVPGRTLALVGGNLLLNGGSLTAPQGQIELGSIASAGRVNLTLTPTGLTFDYGESDRFGTIELAGTTVSTSGLGGGRIGVRGGTVTLTQGASLAAETFGTFDGGGIDIEAGQLSLQGGAFASTSTFGSGAGGHLTIRADTVTLTGTTPSETIQQLFTRTLNPLDLSNGLYSLSGGGAAGDLTIEARELIVRNGASMLTTTFAGGAGGDLTLNISERAELSNGSLLFTGTTGMAKAGDITVAAGQLRVLDGTALSTTPTETSTGRGGDLRVTAELVELKGTPSGALVPAGLFTTSVGGGAAGNLTLTSDRLIVADGAQISTSTSGAGRGGNLAVTADSVELSGASTDGRFLGGLLSSASLLTVPGQRGRAPAGDLSVQARRLSVQNGAQISAATGSAGRAGSLWLDVSESVEVIGFATGIAPSVERVSFGTVGDGIVPSAIEVNTSGGGDAGDLTINTGRLAIRNGAEVGVRSTNAGAAGDLSVTADSILLEEQGTMSAVTVSGPGGNIALSAGNLQLDNSTIDASVLGSGMGGDISIATSQLTLRNGAEVTVNSVGSGNAGNIHARTNFLFLEGGAIAATSILGEGGDIALQVGEGVVLRDRSQISTRAGTEDTGGGDGGNITISARAIATLPQENSDIIANAFEGSGGNINITTAGIFGLKARPQLTPLSDITASSTLGVDGVVAIEQLGVDPGTGLIQLPDELSDRSPLITTGCAAQAGSRFVVTGRGGLPTDPTQALRTQAIWEDWRRSPAPQPQATTAPPPSLSPEASSPRPIVEATGWIVNADNQVELVARPPEIASQHAGIPATNCMGARR
jgi:filamentous hemagglutinin family protein